MDAGVVMWDFEGTLAWRPGLWGACVLEVLDEHAPGHAGTLERIRADLRNGFPWHRPDRPHPELADPDAWWAAIGHLLERAFAGAGITDQARAKMLSAAVRERFTDASRVWLVYEDTRAALEATAAAGRRNAILSNHVPELPRLVSDLGLAGLVDGVFARPRSATRSRIRRHFATSCAHTASPLPAGWSATTRSPTSRGRRSSGSPPSWSAPSPGCRPLWPRRT